MNKKPRVVFAFTEAGLGHIMPLKSIADAFEKKYGDKVEIVRSNFFTETNDAHLNAFAKLLSNEVVKHNKMNWYGFATTILSDIVGVNISSDFVMKYRIPGAYRAGVKHVDDLNCDLMVSTHWATNYYAIHSESKPLTFMYCPDALLNAPFRYKCDIMSCSMENGYNLALKKYPKRYNKDNLKLVPFAIRSEAFDIPQDKVENRKILGLDEKSFVITLAEGGYGIGKMEKICNIAYERDLPFTMFAICGKNENLYNKLSLLTKKGKTTIIPLKFTQNIFNYLCASDVFCGKSGASMVAEPCFFKVPHIITHNATNIEEHNADYYVNYVKSAINIFDPHKVVDKLTEFEENRELLKPYIENAKKAHNLFGAEKSADYIYELLKRKYPNL